MKVVRLVEEISKEEFTKELENNDISSLSSILLEKGLSVYKIKRLLEYGKSFLSRWLKALNVNELFDKGNEFITFMNRCSENCPIFNDLNNFTKAYNAYANGYFSNSGLEANKVLLQLLDNINSYKLSNEDFKNAIRVLDSLSKKLNDDELRKIFFDDPENPETSKVNSLRTIYSLAGEDDDSQKSSQHDNQINRMSDEQFNNFVKQLMGNKRFADAIKSIT